MIKLSECTKEEERVYWLRRAQWWFDQAEWDLAYTNSIDALRDFVRGLGALAWGLGSEDRLEIVE